MSRPTVTDTIAATLREPLTIEVRGADSLPMVRALVTVRSNLVSGHPLCPSGSATCVAHTVQFRTDGAAAGTTYLDENFAFTDQDGRVRFDLRNGLGSGAGQIVITAADSSRFPNPQYRDTLNVTVLSGQPFLVRMAEEEAATLSIGSRLTSAAVVLDRGGALLDVSAIYTSNAGVSVTGAEVQATALRDGWLLATFPGAISDSIQLRVVPVGTIAGVPCYQCKQVVITDLDGRNRRTIELGEVVTDLDWSTDGTRLIVALDSIAGPFNVKRRLATVLPSGEVTRFVTDASVTVAARPYILSMSGTDWLYFAGASAPDGFLLHRARLDGSGLENLRRSAGPSGDGVLGVSPDGRTVAYIVGLPDQIAFQDIPSGTVRFVEIGHGDMQSVRWNPSGTLVAFSGRTGVGFMRPDGTDQRFVPIFQGIASFSIDWSPDGRWLIADQAYGSVLIEASTLRQINLPVAVGRAAWRP